MPLLPEACHAGRMSKLIQRPELRRSWSRRAAPTLDSPGASGRLRLIRGLLIGAPAVSLIGGLVLATATGNAAVLGGSMLVFLLAVVAALIADAEGRLYGEELDDR